VVFVRIIRRVIMFNRKRDKIESLEFQLKRLESDIELSKKFEKFDIKLKDMEIETLKDKVKVYEDIFERVVNKELLIKEMEMLDHEGRLYK
jgi:hypothetical protein